MVQCPSRKGTSEAQASVQDEPRINEFIFPREFPSWQQLALRRAQGMWDVPFFGNFGFLFHELTQVLQQNKWSCFTPGVTFYFILVQINAMLASHDSLPPTSQLYICKKYKYIFPGPAASLIPSFLQVPDRAGDQIWSLHPEPVPTFLTCIMLKMQCQPGFLTQHWNFSSCPILLFPLKSKFWLMA